MLHQCGKKVTTKSQKVLGANSYICKSFKGKNWLRVGAFLAPLPILNRVKGYTSAIKRQFIKMCHLRHSLRIFLFHRKKFLFSRNSRFCIFNHPMIYQTVTSSWVLVHEAMYFFILNNQLCQDSSVSFFWKDD